LYNHGVSTPQTPPHRGAGQRAGLTRQSILQAARRIADTDGVDRLTMRRLAGELGVMPNTLYSYFPHKEALDGLAEVMDASRRLLLSHPQLVSAFLARPTLGPNAARLGEITFTLLRRGGLDGDRAVEAFRVLLIYSLGFAAFQAPRQRTDSPERTRQVEATFAGLADDTYPEMRRLAGHLAAPTTDRPFHTGLRWLLDGISSGGQKN
jgi:AcrR family transcriptional regulator